MINCPSTLIVTMTFQWKELVVYGAEPPQPWSKGFIVEENDIVFYRLIRFLEGKEEGSIRDRQTFEGKIVCQLVGETLLLAFGLAKESHPEIGETARQDRRVWALLKKDPAWPMYEDNQSFYGGAFFYLTRDGQLRVGGESTLLKQGLPHEMLDAAAAELVRLLGERGYSITRLASALA